MWSPLLLLSGLLAACGGGTSATSPAETGACALLPAATASHLLGRPATPTTRPQDPAECQYVTDSGPFLIPFLIQYSGHTSGVPLVVDHLSSPKAASYEVEHFAAVSGQPGAVVQEVDGVKTLWLPFPSGQGPGGRLDTLKGETAVTVWATNETTADRAMATILLKA